MQFQHRPRKGLGPGHDGLRHRGRQFQQEAAPLRVEFGRKVVDQQNGRLGVALFQQIEFRLAQRQRDGAGLSPAGVVGGGKLAQPQLQVVAVRADHTGPPAQLLAAPALEVVPEGLGRGGLAQLQAQEFLAAQQGVVLGGQLTHARHRPPPQQHDLAAQRDQTVVPDLGGPLFARPERGVALGHAALVAGEHLRVAGAEPREQRVEKAAAQGRAAVDQFAVFRPDPDRAAAWQFLTAHPHAVHFGSAAAPAHPGFEHAQTAALKQISPHVSFLFSGTYQHLQPGRIGQAGQSQVGRFQQVGLACPVRPPDARDPRRKAQRGGLQVAVVEGREGGEQHPVIVAARRRHDGERTRGSHCQRS